MSFGLVPICEILSKKSNAYNEKIYDLYVIPFDKNAEVVALEISNELRENGIKVIVEMNNRKIKKCFEWANKRNIPYVTVIGEDEIDKRILSVKNMITGESNNYSFDDISNLINDLK